MSCLVRLPLAALQAHRTSSASAAGAASTPGFGVLIGSGPSEFNDSARVAHIWSAHEGVEATAAELAATLPSGLQLLGYVSSVGDAKASDAARTFLQPLHSLTIVALTMEQQALEEATPTALPQVAKCELLTRASTGDAFSASSDATALIDASSPSAFLSECPVFHASHLSVWYGSHVSDFLARADELAVTLSNGAGSSWVFHDDAAAAAAASATASASASAPTATHSGWRGRIVTDEMGEHDGPLLDTTSVWGVVGEESPLTARKKARAKANTGGGGGGGGKGHNASAASSSSSASAAAAAAAPLPPLPLAEHVIELSLLSRSVPGDVASIGSPVAAPSIQFTRANDAGVRSLTVQLSVLHYATAEGESVRSVLVALRAALASQLQRACEVMQLQLPSPLSSHSSARALTLQSLHFHPAPLPHALTVLYMHASPPSTLLDATDPSFTSWPPHDEELPHQALMLSEAEEALRPQRARLHSLWGLRTDTPHFRFVNALPLPSLTRSVHRALGVRNPREFILPATASGNGPRLFDVHASLLSPASASSTQHVVQPPTPHAYAYYHYSQDRGLADAGWGCAYRTCQTMCSWAVLQGFARERGVPTLGDMQRILVRLGDKAPSFVGSREWIGSTEVSMVLRECYGLECKTLFVSSGSEVVSHARQLADHFRTQGSPVMIGGGVLAYGLLGVDLGEPGSGHVRFLILDPHYTGSDQLAPMLKGGWVGWKGPELFLDEHYYNFCMPQRPRECV